MNMLHPFPGDVVHALNYLFPFVANVFMVAARLI